MAENRDAEVDPRFDPMFQRGYDPKVHGGHRPRVAPRHATAPVPIHLEDARPAAAASVAAPAADHRDASAEPSAAADAAADADLAPRVPNPFRLALLIASIVSIGAAAVMIWNQIGEDMFYGGFSGTNQGLLFRSQLIAALPVPLLTGGLLGVVLWLAIGAMTHRDSVDD